MISDTRSWRNWQTHYLEVVAGQPMEVQILSSAAKQAREFQPPEAINDWARGGCAGAKSSRAPTGVGTGPDRVGVNAAKQARESHTPEAKYDWAKGGS